MKTITFNLNNDMSIISGESRAKVINAYNNYFNFSHPVSIDLGVVKEQIYSELHMLYMYKSTNPTDYAELLEDIYTIGIMYNDAGQSYPLTIDSKLIISLKDLSKTKQTISVQDFLTSYGDVMFNGSNVSIFTEFEIVCEEDYVI